MYMFSQVLLHLLGKIKKAATTENHNYFLIFN